MYCNAPATLAIKSSWRMTVMVDSSDLSRVISLAGIEWAWAGRPTPQPARRPALHVLAAALQVVAAIGRDALIHGHREGGGFHRTGRVVAGSRYREGVRPG